MINTRPPRNQHRKPPHGKPLRAAISQPIALPLNLGHAIDLLCRLAQPDTQVMRAIAEAGDADSDLVPRALDLDGEFAAARRVPDEVADLGRARPPHELALGGALGCLAAEPGVGLDAAFAGAAAEGVGGVEGL